MTTDPIVRLSPRVDRGLEWADPSVFWQEVDRESHHYYGKRNSPNHKQQSDSLYHVTYHFVPEDNLETKIKTSEMRVRILEKQSSWLHAKHSWLYSDLLKALTQRTYRGPRAKPWPLDLLSSALASQPAPNSRHLNSV